MCWFEWNYVLSSLISRSGWVGSFLCLRSLCSIWTLLLFLWSCGTFPRGLGTKRRLLCCKIPWCGNGIYNSLSRIKPWCWYVCHFLWVIFSLTLSTDEISHFKYTSVLQFKYFSSLITSLYGTKVHTMDRLKSITAINRFSFQWARYYTRYYRFFSSRFKYLDLEICTGWIKWYFFLRTPLCCDYNWFASPI